MNRAAPEQTRLLLLKNDDAAELSCPRGAGVRWGLGEFDVYRLWMEYPLHHSTLKLRYYVPEFGSAQGN